ncbi:MAG: ATP-binding cassette domain-containing protein [Gammaproteobacteria bacterium]|nr:ATP-binding cassette domain-containing protein [Gammaproteobacteria bacterium]MCP5424012.1 ATP-binding cassette domain-containing protein [Gammaproteobacteria bacterium]
MIEVEQLSKRFGERLAVDALSFTVGPGEVLGFLGPNGAGKSTTMKMITGFIRPSAGTARINGYDIQAAPLAAKREMGYLPEGAPGYGDMSVRQFLDFIADIRAMSGAWRKERMDEVIQEIHLEQVLDQKIDTLSKGFRRRVGVAQAILHDPRVLIMDEPTDGLDPNQKHEVRNLIHGMAKDKIIVISTHILEEVEAVCSRAIVIARGHLLADGTPEELMARSRYHGAVTLDLDNAREAADLLGQLPEVAAVEDGDTDTEITVLPREGQALMAAIGRVIDQQRWTVRELYQQKGRLDEVFRDITGGAAA